MLHEGSCEVTCERTKWLVLPGRPCWLPPHVVHGVKARGAVSGRSVLFPPSLSAMLPSCAGVLLVSPLVVCLINRLGECGTNDARSGRILAVLLDELPHCAADRLNLPMPTQSKLCALATDIAEDPADARTLRECATHLGMSTRTFVRRFSGETGLSFGQWRCRARIIKAIKLLEEGASITQAGFAVGYESPSAFSSGFRAFMGQSPTGFVSAHVRGRH